MRQKVLTSSMQSPSLRPHSILYPEAMSHYMLSQLQCSSVTTTKSAEWVGHTLLALSHAMLVQAKAAAMWQLLRQRQRPPLLEASEIKGCPNRRRAGGEHPKCLAAAMHAFPDIAT